ncbi:molybdopterin synthase sulfur carrier subunit [Deinococcus seoulensis]|uniref:Molybdopterin synthase sulfur carrier subunit n=1 Tax=Deinococcus seoulensis TaxID=1837379 RepID=A0ABQ2RVA3_9DEIO|nr:molybdenum cofactor biosynthesis protein MoaE [Deinococcus seoulensis]GGR69072.1 molybdopterin synthase sulfur carrier subunit [Deinococcus seoulensis]
MQLNVVFFARLKRETGVEHLVLEAAEGSDVRAVAELVEAQFGISLRGCMVAVNETYASPETVLTPGAEVAFLPPVAGGSGDSPAEPHDDQPPHDGQTHCEVTAEPLRLEQADAYLVRPEYGAQAYFVGTVRSPNKGRTVEFIEYEGYAPMARRVMQGAADAARERHGELRVYLQHRVGRLLPGEASILIGVASPHRRAALEACDFIIEHLKVHVPVWKHEADEDGQHWVDGQTAHDTL